MKTCSNKIININEDIDRHDRIGDGTTDLKGGTVDLHGQSDDYKDRSMYDPYYGDDEDDEDEYVSLGLTNDDEDEDSLGIVIDFDEIGEDYEYDIDRDSKEDLAGSTNYEVTGDSFKDKVENLPDFMEKLNESLDMFKRFKKYN